MALGSVARCLGLHRVAASSAFLPALVVACTGAKQNIAATRSSREVRPVSISRAECYRLSYGDPVGSASVRLFPTWLMLLPGESVGAAVGRHHPQMSDRDWEGLLKYSGWKRMASDSLEIMFTGSSEGIRIHVARNDTTLTGRASWLSDLIGGPGPSMRLLGNREQCTEHVSAGITLDIPVDKPG
jgi:hypothetical protein